MCHYRAEQHMRAPGRVLLGATGLLVSSTIAFSGTARIEIKGDRAVVIGEGGTTVMTCGPATSRTCITVPVLRSTWAQEILVVGIPTKQRFTTLIPR